MGRPLWWEKQQDTHRPGSSRAFPPSTLPTSTCQPRGGAFCCVCPRVSEGRLPGIKHECWGLRETVSSRWGFRSPPMLPLGGAVGAQLQGERDGLSWGPGTEAESLLGAGRAAAAMGP